MTGVIKTDQLQGAQSTTITIPTGNKITITDSAVIGTIDATTVRGTTTFTDSAVFSGVVNATTVQGEGVATTNLKQGVAKLWHQTDASSGTPSTQDSFNLTNITDNGVGNFTFNFTSNMANNDYSFTHYGITTGTYSLYHGSSLSVGTSSLQYRDNKTDNLSSAAAVDHTHINDTIHGDLA